jgi:hypothetical protein
MVLSYRDQHYCTIVPSRIISLLRQRGKVTEPPWRSYFSAVVSAAVIVAYPMRPSQKA